MLKVSVVVQELKKAIVKGPGIVFGGSGKAPREGRQDKYELGADEGRI